VHRQSAGIAAARRVGGGDLGNLLFNGFDAFVLLGDFLFFRRGGFELL